MIAADGRPLKVIDPASNVTKWEYDEQGNPTALVNPLGSRTEVSYDDRGRPIRITRNDGHFQERAYNAHGLLDRIVDFDGSVTRYAYDEDPGTDFWTPSRVIRPDGVEITRRTLGNRLNQVLRDAQGRSVTYRFGEGERLEEIIDSSGGSIRLEYGVRNTVDAVVNQKGLRWTFERDKGGRVIRETDFSGLTFAYAYDRADRLTEVRYADGARLALAYDKSGLLLREEMFEPGADAPADVSVFNYDKRGLLSSARNGSAVIEIERDALGRIVGETRNGRKIANAFDCCSNRVSRVIGGRLVDAVYDPMGALTHLTIDGNRALKLSRDLMGRETRRASEAGFRLEQSWDPLGRLSARKAGFSVSALGRGLDGAPKAQDLGLSPKTAGAQAQRSWSLSGLIGSVSRVFDVAGALLRGKCLDGCAEMLPRLPMGSLLRHAHPVFDLMSSSQNPPADSWI